MGISGRSVCELLLKEGARVVATDIRPRSQFNGSLDKLEEHGCVLRLGEHREEDFLTADQIIISPGVPETIEPLRKAAANGVEVVGELDWAWRRVDLPVVAVTGTNGKTTTTSLIGEIFKNAGKQVFVGGNIGTPLSRWLLEGEKVDALILEVSSFQLDTASRFRPDVGVLLNITEDHLDRYASFAAYADSKLSLFARQSSRDIAIINGDDPLCRERSAEAPGRVLIYSRKDSAAPARVEGSHIVVEAPGRERFSLSIEECALKGVHNEENIMAAALAATAMDLSAEPIEKVVKGYRGLPHRVEWVGAWKGIDFYDDSKGTNVGAVVKALESFNRPVLLLLGGRDKLGSYAPIVESMKGRGKAAFAYGEAAPRIQREIEGEIEAQSFPDLEKAFCEAVKRAAPGDVVLLSPACSSFDQYESYARRGDHFKALVGNLND